MSQKVTYEEFMDRLSNCTNTIVIMSEFLGLHKPLKCKCLVCGYEWTTGEARSILRHGCKKCMDKIRCKNSGISNRKSEEQFRSELAIAQPNLIPNDTYVNGKTKYHCICKIHKCDVYKTPQKLLLRGQGCNLCSIEKNKYAVRYTHTTFCEKVKMLHPNINVVSEYKNIKSRVKVECIDCGYTWEPIAEFLIQETKYVCPKCAGNAIKTPEEFRTEISISHPYLTLLSNYERSSKKIHVLCNKCRTDFWVAPNKLQQGQHCNCMVESHGENRIRTFLESNNIQYESQKTFDDLFGTSGFRKLSYDFYIPNLNTLIEYQGLQHSEPCDFGAGLSDEDKQIKFKKQQEHDQIKRKYAEENGYNLVEIWHWDFKNINSILSKVTNI